MAWAEGALPPPRPLWAGATALGVLLLTAAPLTGPLSTFALGLPVLATCAAWLAGATGRGQPRLARLAAGTLMLAPALGYRATRVGIDAFEAGYLGAEVALHRVMGTAALTTDGIAPLLLAGGLAAAAGLGRAAWPVAGAAIGGAGGAALATQALHAASNAWGQGTPALAARWTQVASGAGLLALVGGLLGIVLARTVLTRTAHDEPAVPAGLRRAPGLLGILALLSAAWLSTPPLPRLVAALAPPPAPASAQTVQALPPGRSFAAPFISEQDLADPARLDARLAGLRLHRQRPGWPCRPLPPLAWADDLRTVAQVALPPDAPLSTVEPALARLVDWGVYEVVLVGRAPPVGGPLGAHARWPGVSLILERPPEGVRWIAADRRGWQVVEDAPGSGEGPAACALLAAPDLRMGELTLLARSLSEPGAGGPCQDALGLVLPAWEQATAGQPAPEGCATTPPRRDILPLRSAP